MVKPDRSTGPATSRAKTAIDDPMSEASLAAWSEAAQPKPAIVKPTTPKPLSAQSDSAQPVVPPAANTQASVRPGIPPRRGQLRRPVAKRANWPLRAVIVMAAVLLLGGIYRLAAPLVFTNNTDTKHGDRSTTSDDSSATGLTAASEPNATSALSQENLLTGILNSVRTEAAPLGGTRVYFDLTNTSTRPINAIEVDIQFIDAVNDAVLVRGPLQTRLTNPLAPGATQTIMLRAPNNSPLNTGLPDTCHGHGVVVKAE